MSESTEQRLAVRNVVLFLTANLRQLGSRRCPPCETQCEIIYTRANMLLRIVPGSVVAVARLNPILGMIDLNFYVAE